MKPFPAISSAVKHKMRIKNVLSPRKQFSPHIETSQLICSENQLTGLHMRGTLVFNVFIRFFLPASKCTFKYFIKRFGKYISCIQS